MSAYSIELGQSKSHFSYDVNYFIQKSARFEGRKKQLDQALVSANRMLFSAYLGIGVIIFSAWITVSLTNTLSNMTIVLN